MLLKDVMLTMGNIIESPNGTNVRVVSCRQDKDSTGVVVGYRAEMITRRYTKNPVKFPVSAENKTNMEQLEKQLQNKDSVTIELKNPVLKLYAMNSSGKLLSGVSVKADGFTIVDDESDLLK